jgi:serine/threonine protein kinase
MKRVRGERLDAAVQSRSLNERLDLFLRLCEAVSFAHARGVVHRDLKPDNIMLGAFGEVLVMDWGLHLLQDADGADVTCADANVANSTTAESADAISDGADPGGTDAEVVGTPGFMAPEQQRGSRQVDGRADVYSLGVILSGLVPVPAPKPLAAIARRASAERADDRYDSARELAGDVVRFRDGEPVVAYRESPVERLARLYRRYQLPVLLILAYVIMRLVLLLWRGV